MPKTGTYFIKVYSNNNTASYQMRVDQAVAGGVTQLNATPGGSQASSTLLNVTSLNVGSYAGNAAGALVTADNGDFYSLGNLNGGNAITLTASAPPFSTLYTGSGTAPAVILSIEKAGSTTPLATSSNGTLTYSIPSGADGIYYAVVSAPSPNYQNIRAQYVLTGSVVDGVAPAVVSTNLPAAGTSTINLINQVTLNFSENLAGNSFAPPSFTDNFATGPSASWGNEVGNWTASGGTYAAQAPANNPATYTSLPFTLTDFSFDVDVNKLKDGGVWLQQRQ